jgi:MFS family permease
MSSEPPNRLYYGYWLIVATFIAQFVAIGMQNYVVGPFMTPMAEELGWTRAEFTLPRTLAQFVMAATSFFIGARVDRFGARPFMIVGALLICIAALLISRVETLWQWVVINGVVLSIGSAMLGNLVVNVTLTKWFVELRGLAVALAAMGVSFAGVVLTPAVTLVIDAYGWRPAWQVLAATTLVLTLPVAAIMRRTPEDHGLHPDGKSAAQVAAGQAYQAAEDYRNSLNRRQALRTATFYVLVVAFGLFTINIGVMLLQTVPFMTDAGYSRAVGALMITVASVPAFVSKPVWGYLIDRLEGRPLAALSATLSGVSIMVIVAAVAGRVDWAVYLGFFLLGCGWGGMIPLQEVIWAAFFGRRYLGSVRGAGLPFALMLSAGGPLAVSYYFDVVGDYYGALLIVATMSLCSAVMLWFVPGVKR